VVRNYFVLVVEVGVILDPVLHDLFCVYMSLTHEEEINVLVFNVLGYIGFLNLAMY
jgi:hypothetical protein